MHTCKVGDEPVWILIKISVTNSSKDLGRVESANKHILWDQVPTL